jgi:hypothetical protein
VLCPPPFSMTRSAPASAALHGERLPQRLKRPLPRTCSNHSRMVLQGPSIARRSILSKLETCSAMLDSATRRCPPTRINACGKYSTFSASCLAAVRSSCIKGLPSATSSYRAFIRMSAASSAANWGTSITAAAPLTSRARVVASTTPSPCFKKPATAARAWHLRKKSLKG